MQDGHRGLIEQEYHHNVCDTILEGEGGLCAKHPTTTLQVIVVEALGVEYPTVKRYL